MIIDFHTHVHPPREAARPFWQGRCPATIENVLMVHERVGLDISVISSAAQYLKDIPREEALPHLEESNRFMASLRDKHKDKILALATNIPGGGDTYLRELERAVKQDDLRGVLISSSHRGAYPDDDDALEFFQLCLVRLHPILWAVKVVPAASTTRKHSASPSLVPQRHASSALHPAL